jgi:hypothetical protein
MIHEIDSAENDVIMDVPFVNVRCQDIFMLSLCYGVGKLPPDLMGFLEIHLARLKGLDQVMGYIVTLVKRL